jgi:hypothetical protein
VGVVLRGRPETPRVVRERFWDLVRSGVAPGDAGVAAGRADGARRWFREAGGVKGNGPGAVSGRYLSLAEREEIAVGLARGADRAAGLDGQPGGGAERAGRAVPGGAGAGAGGAAGPAAEGR